MRKIVEIKLEYTKEELATVLQDAISIREKVSIKEAKVEDGKFIFHCIEGINTLPQVNQVAKITALDFTGNKSGRTNSGLKKALRESLAGDVKCHIDKLLEELKLKGFTITRSVLRNNMIVDKKTFKEVDPNIFQLINNE